MNPAIKKDYAESIYKEKALLIKSEPFDLRSGKKSHIYLNHREMLTKGKYLDLFSQWYFELITTHVKEFKLGCIDEVVSSLLAGAMAQKYQKDVVFTFTNPLWFGTKKDLYGEPFGDIVLIDDVTSSGSTLIEAAKKIRKRGGTVKYAVVAAVRDDRPKQTLAKVGIKLLYLITYKELVSLLERSLTFDEKQLIESEYNLTK